MVQMLHYPKESSELWLQHEDLLKLSSWLGLPVVSGLLMVWRTPGNIRIALVWRTSPFSPEGQERYSFLEVGEKELSPLHNVCRSSSVTDMIIERSNSRLGGCESSSHLMYANNHTSP